MTDGERTPEEVVEEPKPENELDLSPTSSFSLNHRIIPNCALLAVLEPKGQETLVAVSASNKIIIRDTETSLHIPETIRCITSAPFGAGYDYIVIGTDAHVICYDVHNNQTIFRNEVPDGVNCFAVGKVGEMQPAVYCGGNCCIWGFDREGGNSYWTVTGDVVNAICICDYDGDGENELIVGSPDFEIRIFKNDLMRAEVMETDAIVALGTVTNDSFGYALANGTIGVYRREERLWRIKSKNTVSAILRLPNEEMMTCVWRLGKIDMRLITNGDVVSKEQSTSGQVVAATVSKTSKDADSEITVIYNDGKVQGYKLQKRKENADKTQDLIREFGQKKHTLMMELANYEQEEQLTEAEKEREQRIPMDTIVECLFNVDNNAKTLNLVLTATNEVCIRGVVIFSEGLFEGESYIWVPEVTKQGDRVILPIVPEKDFANDMHIKAFLGHFDSYRLHVFELVRLLPRFARFALLPVNPDSSTSNCCVEFELKQKIAKIFEWVHDNFVVDTDSPAFTVDTPHFELRFQGLAPKKDEQLVIRYSGQENKMTIYHNCIETVGNIIQSLSEYFQLQFLESRALFPDLFKEVDDILAEIDPMTKVRDRLTAELQERQSIVKETLVRAEDSIAIDNMPEARKFYVRLKQMDSAARQAALLRWNNNERCVKSLRRLNKIIEMSSRLRVGDAGRQIVSSCRAAIIDDNKQIITKILEFGAA